MGFKAPFTADLAVILQSPVQQQLVYMPLKQPKRNLQHLDPHAISGKLLDGLSVLCRCGDSTQPGIGVPAAAASGMITANTLAPIWSHIKMLDQLHM